MKAIKWFNTIVYPLTIACMGFIVYKVVVGDYPSALAVAVALNLVLLFAFNMFEKRSRSVISLALLVAVLASLSWVLYLISQYQILVLILLIPYLAWALYALLNVMRAIKRPAVQS